ncbi:MAG: hypothetical protein ACI4GW_09185 [Lachnospiraceae bacterium]
MNKIINCTRYALSNIEIGLRRVDFISKTLERKKEGNSHAKRLFLTGIYFIGIIAGICFTLMYKQISITPFDENMGIVVIFAAGIFTSLFFLLLFIRNLLEDKYYKVIYKGEKTLDHITKHLTNMKILCDSYYGLFNNNIKSLDYDIVLGVDIEMTLREIETQIISLEKRKTDGVKNLLVAVYYLAAIAVGTFLVLLMLRVADILIITPMFSGDVQNWIYAIYGICASIGVVGGPIFSRYYFEKIKLISLTDSLLFLIAFSGVMGFLATLLVAAIIVFAIVCVCVVLQAVIGLIFGIIAVVAIIAIVLGLLGGG